MKPTLLAACFFLAFGVLVHAAPGPWDEAAAALTGKISDIMGPGQVRLTVDNQSSIAAGDVPTIRGILEQDLKARGITVSGAESANSLHVTLSENRRERLWVAEVVQGNATQVAIVSLPLARRNASAHPDGLALVSEMLLSTDKPVLGMIESGSGLVVLEPDQLAYYVRGQNGWIESQHAVVGARRAMVRDVRGEIMNASGGFAAWLPGVMCTGQTDSVAGAGSLSAQCVSSDDPWPVVVAAGDAAGGTPLKAFYNARRNFFTGIVTPNTGSDLPAFYSASLVPRVVGGAALLVGGIDGKVQLAENDTLKPVSGTRDWGSDFAVLQSGCGSGIQVVASNSGDGSNDSVRAYELPSMEAVPVSAPLATGGPVIALWSGVERKSVYATIQRGSDQYEVDRVSARCN